jgi:hypothetical protein
MAASITPSLRSALERLKHGGSINGLLLAGGVRFSSICCRLRNSAPSACFRPCMTRTRISPAAVIAM